jgi:hypothetical protein
MTKGHLLDSQIQEILDRMIFEPGRSLPAHLGTCPSCRARLGQYRELYHGLAADPGFDLPPAFADSLLDKIPASRPFFRPRPAVGIPLAAFALGLAATGLFIFVDMNPLTRPAIRIFTAMAAAFRPLPAQFLQIFSKFDGHAGLFILGGLGLLGAALIERMMRLPAWRGR